MTNVSFDFTDQTVLITGASRGIGRAVALRFAKEGAQPILVAKTKAALEEVEDCDAEDIARGDAIIERGRDKVVGHDGGRLDEIDCVGFDDIDTFENGNDGGCVLPAAQCVGGAEPTIGLAPTHGDRGAGKGCEPDGPVAAASDLSAISSHHQTPSGEG